VRIAVDTGDVSSSSAPLSSASTAVGTAQGTATLALDSASSGAGDPGLAAAASALAGTLSGQLELGAYALSMLAKRMQSAATNYDTTDSTIAGAEHRAR
jgi:hypothetical protein